MPDAFFVSNKTRKRKRSGSVPDASGKSKKQSDGEERSASEDESETPAEKKLRLAKLYLESVKEGLAEGEFDAADVDMELISAHLKQNVLEYSGKIHLFVADSVHLSQQPQEVLRTRGHRLSVTSAVASESGEFMYTAGKEGSIIKWVLKNGAKQKTIFKVRPDVKGKGKAVPDASLPGHTDEVLALAFQQRWECLTFRKDSHQLYSGSFDSTLKVYDLSPDVMGYVETLFGHQDVVLLLDALRGETCVSVGGRDKTARFWEIVKETQLVFRGGVRSRIRDVHEGGLRGEDVEGSLECVAMVDETTFLTRGDSG
uniref:Uncharacterized protein n=1 Tax=Schizophyllum commune (strain H4-8 / FGSC 9210) TaxID=578458 RepID=D8Q8P0_SCHCM